MKELLFLGFSCIFTATFLMLRDFIRGYDLATEQERLYKNMNRDSIILGIGTLAFVYYAICTHHYVLIALSSLGFFYNLYSYMERNQNLKTR